MARKSRTLAQIEYAAARIALGLLGVLPRRSAIRVATWIVLLVPIVVQKLRRTGLRNLEIAFPEKSVDDRRGILRGTFENLGRVLGELSQFSKYDHERLADLIDFNLDDTSRSLYELQKQGQGVLITTGHLGNWEMLVLGFAALYEPISYLARPLDNPLLDDMLNEHRTRYGNNPINKRNSAMLAAKILRDGGILGILADVNAHPKEGVFVPFFGVDACTSSGAAMLAIRSGALIYPTFCVWEKEEQRYKFVHGSILKPADTGDRKQDIIDTTAAYTAEIEAIIRQYPDQWMWIHKRWKTRPPGEPSLY
ncbi:MAG TPA: lysophospholipid acyltransferase family protein [Pyrinomonadaceae bacterium]|jgi:KDO2-lipid IV(A) lauroyltransferase|nr:lysophospholipid acyltransferase family protein [Pyrinomonadaceae bacterium]